MLYGYTNSIYVLDHTPEPLSDMDMLQLFASPAGRALIGGSSSSRATGEDRQTKQSRSSTSSLTRESALSKLVVTAGSSREPAGSLSSQGSNNSSSSLRSRFTLGSGSASAPASPRQRKSSTELYKEAVEILGLTCTLSDSCRCIDCQSNYFDYEDDYGDTRTELAAGTPVLLDHALTHPLTCSIQ
ncbi:hypothetical protein TKK_0019353 [Trichogramma kaykai]|uniref:DUF4802 domain-containing protein n=1 Tax=Trichogramma kaykai TaxID=54128 RepID=A0ABD2VTA1_9HYME